MPPKSGSMGKRDEKKGKDKSTKDFSEDSSEISEKKNVVQPLAKDNKAKPVAKDREPYNCVGKFHKDFKEMGLQKGLEFIPPVQLKPTGPPPTQNATSHATETKPEKAKKGKVAEKKEDVASAAPEDEEVKEPEFKTFLLKDSPEFFKPCVYVDMEHPDKQETVTEVFIRGWRVDYSMMDTLMKCFIPLEKLSYLHFWNVGITAETILDLAGGLTLCPHVKTLALEANPIQGEENFSVLIDGDSQIQTLLLRHNAITDVGALKIGTALGTAKRSNTKMFNLNLNGNQISSTGAVALANGLRTNRTLLCFSLGNNKIGDEGVTALAETLSRFQLTHEEIVERRRLFGEQRALERQKSATPWGALKFTMNVRSRGAKGAGDDRPASQTRSQSQEKGKTRDKSSTKGKKDAKEDKEAAKKGKKDTKDAKKSDKNVTRASDIVKEVTRMDTKENTKLDVKGADKEQAKSPGKTTTKKPGKGEKRGKDSNEPGTPDLMDVSSPLLEEAEALNPGELWIQGNRAICNLNLARNKIGNAGVEALLKALQYQAMLQEFYKSQGTGLMRLPLQNNLVPESDKTLIKLNDIMTSRDPMAKLVSQSSTPAPGDAGSSIPPKSESRAGRAKKGGD